MCLKTLSPLLGLILIVAMILLANRLRAFQRLFQCLPLPLWYYVLPMLAVSLGWLPRGHPVYPTLTNLLLPFALGLLLLSADLSAILRIGWRALAAMVGGATSILVGALLMAWVLRGGLPPEAWRGVGALAGTWTGGSMNLLALRAILQTPEAIFTSLIFVDALIAYSWMALLVGLSRLQGPIDRWLRAGVLDLSPPASVPFVRQPRPHWALPSCVALAGGLTVIAGACGRRLPITPLIRSASGWTVLLVTTFAMGLSLIAPIRRLGGHATTLGYPCLYVVLAAMGAQASFAGVWSSPIWLALGAGVALVHGTAMLLIGRLLRVPLGLLATASQANFGGVVSAPMVGAIYHHSLVPVGLLLAIAGNAVGTYLGLLAAFLGRGILEGL